MTSTTLASRFLSVATKPSADPDWEWAAAQVQRAGQFALAGDVIRLDLREIDTNKLLPAIEHGLRLPHEPCWIEWSPKAVFSTLEGNPDAADQYGMLLWRDDAGDICNRLVERRPMRGFLPNDPDFRTRDQRLIMLYPCDAVSRPLRHCDARNKASLRSRGHAGLSEAGRDLVLVRLVAAAYRMTAKNAPLAIGEAEDFSRLNKQRQRKGNPPLLNARPVRWDFSRIQRRAARTGVALTEEERQAADPISSGGISSSAKPEPSGGHHTSVMPATILPLMAVITTCADLCAVALGITRGPAGKVRPGRRNGASAELPLRSGAMSVGTARYLSRSGPPMIAVRYSEAPGQAA